jgi:hypothetical protein
VLSATCIFAIATSCNCNLREMKWTTQFEIFSSATEAAAVEFARTRVESQRSLSNGGQRAEGSRDLHDGAAREGHRDHWTNDRDTLGGY